MSRPGAVRIGISGWTYPPWRGVFYPADLPHTLELEYASRAFNSIEINGTFYSLQRPTSFAAWAARTPEDFVFSLKGSRFITHALRLRRFEAPLANFFASGMLALGKKLGPFLRQFPPNFQYDPQRIEPFLAALPHDTEALAALAAQHDSRMRGRAFLDPAPKRRVRHAMEIRHDSFRSAEFIRLLRKYKVALVCADAVEWPRLMDVTSDFVYCRLHGSEELYASGYKPKAIEEWARRIEQWRDGAGRVDGEYASDRQPPKRLSRDVFAYFDNDRKVRAPRDAKRLSQRVGNSRIGTCSVHPNIATDSKVRRATRDGTGPSD